MIDGWDDEEMDKHELKILRQVEADRFSTEEHILRLRTGKKPKKQEVIDAMYERGMKVFEEYCAVFRIGALAKAQVGDFSELAEIVRAGGYLKEDEREFLADFMIGKVSTKIGAPKKHLLRLKVCTAFFWRSEFDGLKRDAVIAECEARFKRSKSTIEKHVSDGKTCPIVQDMIIHYRNLINIGRDDLVNNYRNLDLQSE